MTDIGRLRLQYQVEFPVNSVVKIAERIVLEAFSNTWQYHHKITPQQLAFAGRTARVKTNSIYHGGDVLYELNDVPGIWHQHLLAKDG